MIFWFSAATAAVESKLNKDLKKFLKKTVLKDAVEELAIADAKLGNIIKVNFYIIYIYIYIYIYTPLSNKNG